VPMPVPEDLAAWDRSKLPRPSSIGLLPRMSVGALLLGVVGVLGAVVASPLAHWPVIGSGGLAGGLLGAGCAWLTAPPQQRENWGTWRQAKQVTLPLAVFLAAIIGVSVWNSFRLTPSAPPAPPPYSVLEVRDVSSHVRRAQIRITVMPGLSEQAMDRALEAASREHWAAHPELGAIHAVAAFSNSPSQSVRSGHLAPGGNWDQAGGLEPWSYRSSGP
jgi:hypothetical protein